MALPRLVARVAAALPLATWKKRPVFWVVVAVSVSTRVPLVIVIVPVALVVVHVP